MNLSQNITALSTIFILISCNPTTCEKEAEHWINEAPNALNEFLSVKEEVLANQAFLDSFTKQGEVFIGGAGFGPDKFEGYNLPKLKAWFEAGRGYISLEPGDTSACFRKCEYGDVSTNAYLRMVKETRYSYNAKTIDSVKLQKGWFAEVVKCKGCGS